MALVQHRLDGLEQRCARATELVVQCPVGPKEMTRQRTIPGARRALVQRPDQVPAQARQAHRLRRPGLGQCLEPGQHALLRQRQARCPVAQVLGELRALPHPERLDAPRHLLNQRLDMLGAVQLTGLDVDTLQRPAQRVHRRLERIESLDGLATLAPRSRQCAFGLASVRLVIRAYLAQSPQRFSLAFNRPIGAPLQTPAHLVHLVEHMKTIVALLGVRKHLAHPRRNPTRRILHNHRQPQPLRLTLAKQLRPCLTIARRTQRQPEQIPRVEVHPGQHRLALAEHLIERPGLDPAERDLRVEPRRASLGIDQHVLNRPVRDLHPGIEQRHQILNRADGVGREHTQRHHRPA